MVAETILWIILTISMLYIFFAGLTFWGFVTPILCLLAFWAVCKRFLPRMHSL